MSDLRTKLLAAFAQEHREHLDSVRQTLAAAEEQAWQISASNLDECFRRVHSLKGAARAVDLPDVESLAHGLESLCGRLRRGTLALDEHHAAIIREALDVVEELAAPTNESARVNVPGVKAIERRLEEVLAGQEQVAARAPEPVAAPGTETKSEAKAAPAGNHSAKSFRLPVARLDEVMDTAAECISNGARLQTLCGDADGLVDALLSLDRKQRSVARATRSSGAGLPATAIHDVLQLARRLHEGLQGTAWQAQQTNRLLHRQVTRLRLVSADNVFGGLRNHVRQLARDEGKQVRFETHGMDTAGDRRVLQHLSDPLLHILRNAITHGVELPEERLAAGKAAEARVTLRLAARADTLMLEIIDDGRGVNVAKLTEQAVGDDNAPAGDRDLLQLMTRSGVSTAAELTRLAGRGLGLAIVEDAVQRLQGSLEFEQPDGGGTLFRINVPLTVASLQLLFVQVAGQPYALPGHAADGVYRLRQDQIGELETGLCVSVESRDRAVPFVWLADCLGIASPPAVDADGNLWAVLLRGGGTALMLAVDNVIAVRDEMIRDTGGLLANDHRLVGAVSMENGQAAPVLNPSWLLSRPHSQPATALTEAVADSSPRARVLVVDDSVTTRTLEKSILEASGYAVSLAVDGREALKFLVEQEVDLVIADVEMPVMNGFELLAALKRDARLATLPVIMVTSRSDADDRRRGLELGANAYLAKQTFDQAELLQTIGRLL